MNRERIVEHIQYVLISVDGGMKNKAVFVVNVSTTGCRAAVSVLSCDLP